MVKTRHGVYFYTCRFCRQPRSAITPREYIFLRNGSDHSARGSEDRGSCICLPIYIQRKSKPAEGVCAERLFSKGQTMPLMNPAKARVVYSKFKPDKFPKFEFLYNNYLCDVKNYIAFILAFYILFSATVPCSIFDNCEEREQAGQTPYSDHKKDCNNCSPFSTCASAPGFTISPAYPGIGIAIFDGTTEFGELTVSPGAEYYSTLFQPPRQV